MHDEDPETVDGPLKKTWRAICFIAGFVMFVVRTFRRYWGWAWRRYRGRLPARRGALDHHFMIRVTTKLEGYTIPSPVLVFDDVTLEGELSGAEACRLLSFLGIEEEPPNAILCRGGSRCTIRGGVHGAFVSSIPGGGDGFAVRVAEGSTFIVPGSVKPTVSGSAADVRIEAEKGKEPWADLQLEVEKGKKP